MAWFFSQHKDLFDYDKYVGHEEPSVLYQAAVSSGSKSFLQQYQECDKLPAPMTSSSMFSNLMLDTTAMVFHGAIAPVEITPSFPTATYPKSRAFSTESSPAPPHLSRFNQSKTSEIALHDPEESKPIARLSVQQIVRHRNDQTIDHSPPRKPEPDNEWKLLQNQLELIAPVVPDKSARQHVKSPVKQHHRVFDRPKLSSLLIDSAGRTAILRHKRLDEAQKIELLIGSKCIGRISTVSTNLPSSIRRRLQASANLSQRRERLYTVLLHDYRELYGL